MLNVPSTVIQYIIIFLVLTHSIGYPGLSYSIAVGMYM